MTYLVRTFQSALVYAIYPLETGARLPMQRIVQVSRALSCALSLRRNRCGIPSPGNQLYIAPSIYSRLVMPLPQRVTILLRWGSRTAPFYSSHLYCCVALSLSTYGASAYGIISRRYSSAHSCLPRGSVGISLGYFLLSRVDHIC